MDPFYALVTSGSGGPACLQRRDRRLRVCPRDGRINMWTRGRCLHCQTVCRWRTDEEAERRQHGPTEAAHLQLWVSAPSDWFLSVSASVKDFKCLFVLLQWDTIWFICSTASDLTDSFYFPACIWGVNESQVWCLNLRNTPVSCCCVFSSGCCLVFHSCCWWVSFISSSLRTERFHRQKLSLLLKIIIIHF